MIVTCERCTTQFQLDESRVPETGVRVRCSRCKHAFLVETPAKSELEKVQRVAGRALEESEEGPATTQDLPPSSVVEDGASGLEREFLDDDESDWEFNDGAPAGEGPGGREGPRAARSGVDALLGASPESAAAGHLAGATDEADALDLELGSGRASEAASDDALELDTQDSGGEPPRRSSPALETPPAQTPGEELGSPSEWDIFDESAPPQAEAPPLETASASARVPLEGTPPPDVFDEPAEAGIWLRRAGAVVGWAATVALCAAGLATGLAPRPPASAQTPAVRVAGLRLEDVSARWLDNVHHGAVYVVSGALRNPGDVAVSGDRVALVLRDGAGRRLGEPVPLGPTVETRLLREGRLASIRRAQASDRAALSRAIGPRRSVPFEAVVGPVPPEARRFGFEESERASSRKAAPVVPEPDPQAEASALDRPESGAPATGVVPQAATPPPVS